LYENEVCLKQWVKEGTVCLVHSLMNVGLLTLDTVPHEHIVLVLF